VKRIQYNTIQACHETHADRELRENLIKRSHAEITLTEPHHIHARNAEEQTSNIDAKLQILPSPS
jgi:hypothetical protein